MTDRIIKIQQLQQKDRMDRFVQLKLYEQQSVMPNLAAKSMLFKPTAKGRRPHFPEWEAVPVVNLPEIEMHFRYTQLDQNDLTGWLVLIQFAKHRDDLVAAFNGKEFLRRMRRQGNSRDYAWLNSFVDRINGTQLRIGVTGKAEGKDRKYIYQEALAPRFMAETTQNLYALELSKVLWAFFGVDSWSFVDLNARLALGQNQMAMAFQAFLMANQSPYWATWEAMHALWGAGYAEERLFRRKFQMRVLKPLLEQGIVKNVIEKSSSIGVYW